jgi:uncharacterized membrane protein
MVAAPRPQAIFRAGVGAVYAKIGMQINPIIDTILQTSDFTLLSCLKAKKQKNPAENRAAPRHFTVKLISALKSS